MLLWQLLQPNSASYQLWHVNSQQAPPSIMAWANGTMVHYVAAHCLCLGNWTHDPAELRQADISFQRFKRLLKTFLFRCWDRGALWLTVKAASHKFSHLRTYYDTSFCSAMHSWRATPLWNCDCGYRITSACSSLAGWLLQLLTEGTKQQGMLQNHMDKLDKVLSLSR